MVARLEANAAARTELAATLGNAQVVALIAARSYTYKTATELNASPASLAALVKKGLVEVHSQRVQSSNPRARVSNEPIIRSYRATYEGTRILKVLGK